LEHTKVRLAATLLAALVLITAASPLSLASIPSPEQTNEPVAVRLYYDSRDQLSALATQYDMREVQPDRGYAVILLSSDEFQALGAQGYRMEIDPERTREARAPFSIPGYPYHTPTQHLAYSRPSSLPPTAAAAPAARPSLPSSDHRTQSIYRWSSNRLMASDDDCQGTRVPRKERVYRQGSTYN